MARSHAVWVVIQYGHPVAAFTVKHELKSWLTRQDVPPSRPPLRVFRCPDSPYSYYGNRPIQEIDIDELLE